VRSLLLGTGARELFSSREIPGEIVDVLVVREDILRQRKASLCHLMEAYFLALAELRQDPMRAAAVLAGPEGISPEELVAAWQRMHLPDRGEAGALLEAGSGSLLPTLAKLEEVMAANHLLSRDVDAEALLAPGLIAGCAQ